MRSAANSIPDTPLSKKQFESLSGGSIRRQVSTIIHPLSERILFQCPHRFSQLQDIEIAGFFAAIMAWGQRKTIINKANELMALMDDAPYDFIRQHHGERPQDDSFAFKHRTLQPDDILYLVDVLATILSKPFQPGRCICKTSHDR